MAQRRLRIKSQELGPFLRRFGHGFKKTMMQVESKNIEQALQVARQFSLGTTPKLQEFHPYSRSLPITSVDPAIVNYEGGNFFRDWRIYGPEEDGNHIIARLTNYSFEAEFILNPEGTRKMVARPILARVVLEIRKDVRERRRRAVSKFVSTVR